MRQWDAEVVLATDNQETVGVADDASQMLERVRHLFLSVLLVHSVE